MISPRIMQVFFGDDLLPYKDSARTIHYPITQGSFLGSNNTKEIRFYVRDIGGTTNISWVVISKLPNGKVGYELCSNVQLDEELGEYYLSFDLGAYYTQVKGDLYLALRGYQGEVEFEDDDSDGVYNISGDPLIEVTGTIKLAINYSPMVNTGTQVLPTDIDRIIAALSNYLKIKDGILVVEDISQLTASDYKLNQILLEYDGSVGAFYYVKETSGVKSFVEITFDSLRTNQLRVSNYILLTNNARFYYDDNKLKMTVNGHTLALDTSGNLTIDSYNVINQNSGDIRYLVKYDNDFSATTTLQELYNVIGDTYPCLFIYKTTSEWYVGKLFGAGVNAGFEFESLSSAKRFEGDAPLSTTLGTIINTSGIYYKPYDIESYVELSGTSGTLTSSELEKVKRPNATIKITSGGTYILHKSFQSSSLIIFKALPDMGNSGPTIDYIYYIYLNITVSSGAWTFTRSTNTFYNKAGVDSAIASAMTSALVYQGTKTVAEINALDTSTLKVGYFYNISDSGIITLGSLEVFAGDNICWTGSGWDKLTMDLSVYDDKFIAAGFFEVQNYNTNTGEITFVYSSDLYSMSYDTTSGILTIDAN